MNDWQLLQELFAQGSALEEKDRIAFLERRCPNRKDIHDRLLSMWKNGEEGDFVNIKEIQRQAAALLSRALGKIPNKIGVYRIMEALPGGGGGAVFKALQEEPIPRTVALKILPRGLHVNEYLRRFETEQKALANLNHPYVVTVFDAGLTSEGLPYFTTEFVEGQPISQYCNVQKLTLKERLVLFEKVCDGVHHLQLHGVIHRDLKPENILVYKSDGVPCPKIIDFGIAKFNRPASQTEIGTILGTRFYMSPEQAAGMNEVDMRTDIYALGIILYELLTGVTPFQEQMNEACDMREVHRVLLEEKIVPVSRQIERRPQARAMIFGRRPPDRALDWICLKALSQKPQNRYQSADELRQEIRRYLSDEPVLAGPPDSLYQLQKYLARHKVLVLWASMLLFSLLAGAIGTGIQLFRVMEAEEKALISQRETELILKKYQAVNSFLINTFKAVDPYREGPDIKGVELLEKAAYEVGIRYREEPELEAETRMALAYSYRNLGLFFQAGKQFQRAYNLRREHLGPTHVDTLKSLIAIAFIASLSGDPEHAAMLYQRCLERLQAWHPLNTTMILICQSGLADALGEQALFEQASPLFRNTLDKQILLLGVDHPHTVATRNSFGKLLLNYGYYQKAEKLFKENLALHLQTYGEEHPFSTAAMHQIARIYQVRNELEAAEDLFRRTWVLRRKVLGEKHPDTVMSLNSLALVISKKDPKQAIDFLQKTIGTSLHPDEKSPIILLSYQNLGHLLMLAGSHHRANDILRQTEELKCVVFGHDHESTLITRVTLAENLLRSGHFLQAEAIFRTVQQEAWCSLGPQHPLSIMITGLWGHSLAQIGKLGAAEALMMESLHRLEEMGNGGADEIADYLTRLHAFRR